MLDEINDDYFFAEYEFSKGYSFLDELRSGRVLQLDDSTIPISKKTEPEQISSIKDVADTLVKPPEITTIPSDLEQERLSSDVSIILKPAPFETYRKIVNFRPFTKQSHVRIKLKDLKSLFRSFNTERLSTTSTGDHDDPGLFGNINTPYKTSHRKAQLGTKFYVDGTLKETLISLKPITEKDGYVPDYQIKNIKAIFASLPIHVSCKEYVEQSIVSEEDQLAMVMPLFRK